MEAVVRKYDILNTDDVVLVGLDVREVRWVREHAYGGDDLFDDIPIWL